MHTFAVFDLICWQNISETQLTFCRHVGERLLFANISENIFSSLRLHAPLLQTLDGFYPFAGVGQGGGPANRVSNVTVQCTPTLTTVHCAF